MVTLTEHFASKQSLLILDNCEHLITACAQLAARLLGACGNLRILATSREALDILGETIWMVPSLTLPRALQHAGYEGADQGRKRSSLYRTRCPPRTTNLSLLTGMPGRSC